MGLLQDQLGNAATGIIGGGLGLLLGGINDRRQLKQQQKLQDQQIAGNKEMANHMWRLQKEMWDATNYSAQVEHLKKAGLNAGLIYGMSGGGGVTTGSPSGTVSGATAPIGGGEAQALMGLGLQNQLMKAQKDLITAQTEKTQAEAEKIGGVDTQLGKAQIENLTATTGNTKADTELKGIQTEIAKLDKRLKNDTLEDQIKIISWQTSKIIEEVNQIGIDNHLNQKLIETKIALAKKELLTVALQQAYIQASTEQTKRQTKEIDNDLYIKMAQLDLQSWGTEQGQQNTNIAERQQALNEWMHDVSDSMKIPFDIVEKITQAIIVKDLFTNKPKNPIGFRQ